MNLASHDYQTYAVNYTETRSVAAVLLDMGLRKTVISLTAIADLLFDSFEAHRILVVALLRVVRDIRPAEIKGWQHLKYLIFAICVRTSKERKNVSMVGADMIIINRENLQWLIESSGFSFDYDMVVTDELSFSKDHNPERFKSPLKMRPSVKHIIGLTGIPSNNGPMDLRVESRLLDLGERLGCFITKYRNNYFVPDKRNGQIIYSYKPQPYVEERIYSQISDTTIPVKSIDHLQMPELISPEYEVHLSEDEVAKYEELKSDSVLDLPDGGIIAANAASLTGKLSQLADGAIYSDIGEIIEFHDRKLDALEDITESANDKPVLVAYWFKHDPPRIKKRFDAREIKSSNDITDWNVGKIPVVVIHPASVGHGPNLQAGGSTLIRFGLTWSLELYQQTNARLRRQGQASGTAVIEYTITKGTIDECTLKILPKKELTQNALIDAVKANL